MLKQTLTYDDFNGESRTDDFLFHMSKIEWLRFDRKYHGLKEFIQDCIRKNDDYAILLMLEELIRSAYGERSADGLRFIKSQELSEQFAQTNAYEELLTGFLTDQQKAIDFFNNLAPKEDTTPAVK